MLEMAYICGLPSIDEAYSNIISHSVSLFSYTDINNQERELVVDMVLHDMLEEIDGCISIIDAKVSDYLSEEERETIDKDMEEVFQRND